MKTITKFLTGAFCACLLAVGLTACEKHTHSYTEKITAPTCTEQGYTTYTCSCGHNYTENYIDELGHEFKYYFSDDNATYEQDGTETAICNRVGCWEKYTRVDEDSQLGHQHKFEFYFSDNNATFEQNCTETAVCEIANCGIKNTREIADTMLDANLYFTVKYDTIMARITGLTDYGKEHCTELIIPSKINGESVRTIEEDAFVNCNNLSRVVIPDSVTEIKSNFSDCGGLTEIIVSENNINYQSIGGDLYSKDGKTLIQYAIGKKITTFTVPSSVTRISSNAFKNNSSLTSITIFDNVTSIGNDAFYNTTYYNDESNWKNDELYIGKHLIDVKTNAVGNFFVRDWTITIAGGAFRECSNLTSITLPDSVTSIGEWAFYGCHSLTSVTIPNGVTSIGDSTFRECRSLTSITIPDSVISIGEWAFCNCTGLTSVTIPDSVISIGEWAFCNCTSLTSVTIGNGVRNIRGSVFRYCISLTSITIPSSVTTIGYWAFCDCRSLTSITIPNSVNYIRVYSFYGCKNLTSIRFNGTMEEWKIITKEINWYSDIIATEVVCIDGTVAL